MDNDNDIGLSYKFGQRLKKMRVDKEMTQAGLAARAGISASAVGMYEQGRREPSLEMIFKFCDIFGTEPGYLLGYKPVLRQMDISAVRKEVKQMLLMCDRVTLNGEAISKDAVDKLLYGYRIAEEMIMKYDENLN